MGYQVEIYADSIECHDPESVTTKDVFAMVGSVLVDGTPHGFLTPKTRVGRGETQSLGGYPTGPGELFRGFADDPRIGIMLRGYDIDANRGWVDNREDVKKVLEAIEKITDDIPVVGDIAGYAAKIPDIVDVFVDADVKDLVLGHAGWIDLTASVPEQTVTEWRTIRTRRDDDSGYSSSDYVLNLRITYRVVTGSLGEVQVPRLRPAKGSRPEDWAGLWQSEHVTCAIAPSVSALGEGGVLSVELTEIVDGTSTELGARAAAISHPYLDDLAGPPIDIPTSRQGEEEEQQNPLIGGGTVEGTAAGGGGGPIGGVEDLRTEVERSGGQAAEPVVDVLDRAAAGRRTSKADYVALDGDAVLELYQERVGGEVVGARIRYVRPASAPVRAGAQRVDEMMHLRVV